MVLTKKSSMNKLITSTKIILMSTGFLFITIFFSLTLPHLLTFFTSSQLPTILSTFKAWLRPPYLYFIINGIIITIVASSRLHYNHHHAPLTHEGSTYAPPQVKFAAHDDQHDVTSLRGGQFEMPYGDVLVGKDVEIDDGYGVVSVKEVVVEDEVKEVVEYAAVVTAATEEEVEEVVVRRDAWTPPPSQKPLMRQAALPGLFTERPPASSRFRNHRRPARTGASEGGKALRRVANPKKHDTLESTWKTITEGRHIPLTRHLKSKSETWENNHDRQINILDDSSSPQPEVVKKSQTFHDRTNYTSPPVSTTKLKKEPSLGQEELNRRVEAFINKFNQDMRLQRQQSMQQFMEMINRAA